MDQPSFINSARSMMQSWFHAASLRTVRGEGIVIENGKNEVDVLGGCSPAPEALDLVTKFAVLGVNSAELRGSYTNIMHRAVEEIARDNPAQAKQILSDIKAMARAPKDETPWLWYAALETQERLGL